MARTFTPGPWTASHVDGPPYRYGVPQSVYAGCIPIAIVAGGSPAGPAEWTANAKLLAAAPTLLAACKRARADLTSTDGAQWQLAQLTLAEAIRAAEGA